MELPKTISAVLEFEVAKLQIKDKYTVKCKYNKYHKKILKLTMKYIKQLMKMYAKAEIYFNGQQFIIDKLNKGE